MTVGLMHVQYKGNCVLILTRRIGETLMIGSDITVTVVGVKGGQIRIGINAPKNIPVHRKELYERIRCEHRDWQTSKIKRVSSPERILR